MEELVRLIPKLRGGSIHGPERIDRCFIGAGVVAEYVACP
jgi:hypothetical protein